MFVMPALMCFRASCTIRCAISGSRVCRTRACKRGTCQGFIACAGIAHLMGSLNKEAKKSGAPVRVHCLSPGMVLTDLLLAGATDRNKQVRFGKLEGICAVLSEAILQS